LMFTGIAAYIVLTPGFGITQQASAQVNVGRIGESVIEQVGEAQQEATQNAAEAMGATEGPEEVEEPGEVEIPIEGVEAGLPEGITEEMIEEAEAFVAQRILPSPQGIDGPKFSELTIDQIRQGLLELDLVTPDQVEFLLPIALRFQAMIQPPIEYANLPKDVEKPWQAKNTSRFSPFDQPGISNPIRTRSESVPPFRPLTGDIDSGGKDDKEPFVSHIVALTRLKGVIGTATGYRAIIEGAGYEKNVGVGDLLVEIGEFKFMVQDISLHEVKIIREDRPGDIGVISFGRRVPPGTITEFSISYE